MHFISWSLAGRLLLASGMAFLTPALLLASIFWLLATESGLQTGLHWLEEASGGQIRVSGAQGKILGALQFDRIEITTGPAQPPLLIDHLQLDWQPLALLEGKIHLSRLHLKRLRLPRGSEEPLKRPDDLRLPLSLGLRVDHLEIAALDAADDTPLLRSLKASFFSDSQQHELFAATARWHEAELQAQGKLMAAAPFPLTAALTARLPALKTDKTHLPASRWTARLSGSLDALRADVEGQPLDDRTPLAVQGQAQLTPFARQPLAALQVSARKLNPRAFSPQAPDALLTGRVDLRPDSSGALAGSLHLDNERPSSLDQNGLPLSALSARLSLGWNASPRRLKLDDLQLRSGPGQVRGRIDLAWPEADQPLPQGMAKLRLQQINPALWHSTLRPFRLDGQIELDAQAGQSRARLSLGDGPFRIEADVRHADTTLSFDRIELRHGPARIAGRGSLGLDARHPWRLQGSVSDFDPALFAHVPPANLNAEFSADGSLKPTLSGTLKFALLPSELAGEALNGQTTLTFTGFDHPAGLLQADGRTRLNGRIELGLGASKLSLAGGFGHAEDRLRIHVDAPALARHHRLLPDAPGLAGSLRLDGEVAGFPRQPQFTLSAQADHLVWPGRFRLDRLTLEGGLSPRDLRLKVLARGLGQTASSRRVGTEEEGGLSSLFLEQCELDIEGTRQQHQIRLAARRAGLGLFVQMSGGLREAEDWQDSTWQGLLSQFRLETGPQANTALALLKNPTLQTPAALRISRQDIELQATSLALAGGRLELLQTRWTPQGWLSRGRFGEIALSLAEIREAANASVDAGPALRAAGQWQVAQSAGGGLSGQIDADIPDLRGLAAAIHGQHTSAGSLKAHLKISGQHDHPQLQGEIRGERLAFGMPSYGLQLNNGVLAVRLAGDRILVDRLHFDAPHHPGERALKTSGFALPARPGQVDVQGEILPWQQAAQLDVRLTQLPVLQRRDRWLVVSGEGRVGQNDGALRLTARLAADAGFISSLDGEQPQLPEDVVVLGRKKSTSSSRLETDISLDLGERFQLHAAGLKARLAGQIRLRGNPLQATGSIAAQSASFEAYGQQLAVTRGIVNFQGPIDNPGLNVLATRQGGAVEAGVSITGTVRQPVVKLVSTPNVPDAEKLSWIVLGRAPDSGGTDTGVLFAAAGSLLGGGKESLTTQLAQGLGFDEISVHGTNAQASGSQTGNGSGLENQVITIGKRLSSRAYLSYDQGLSAARGALKLSYALGRRLSIVTRAGEEGAVDVFYNFSFD